MATISFFAGYEIKDVETAKKILKVLEEPGDKVELTEDEKVLLKEQEELGKKLLENIDEFLKELNE